MLRLFLFVLVLLPFVTPISITANSNNDYVIGATNSGCSLRGAIVNANAGTIIDNNCPSGANVDTIIISSNFVLANNGRGEENGRLGDLDITKSLTIQAVGNNFVTIDANGIDRIFDVHGNLETRLTLKNLILTNGNDNGEFGQRNYGGAIRSQGKGEIDLQNVQIISNTVSIGSVTAITGSAGISLDGEFFATNVTFRENIVNGQVPSGSRMAAALYINDQLTDSTLTISGDLDSNAISQLQPYQLDVIASGGIGIFGNNGLVYTGSIVNNRGITGGAMYIGPDARTIDYQATASISGNTADIGGVFYHAANGVLRLEMYEFDIHDNSARMGGVIHAENNARVAFEKFGSIYDNHADFRGGVGHATNSKFALYLGDSIHSNTADGSGGVFWVQDSDIDVTFVDSILSNVAFAEGGFAYIERPQGNGVLIDNVSRISFNSATEAFNSIGGFISAYSADVMISNIDEITNQFSYEGGVISLINNPTEIFTAQIQHVANITSNRVDHSDGAGAVIYSINADATISDIYGRIYNNSAHNGDGGLIYTEGATALFTDSACDIYDNFAFKGAVLSVDNAGTAIFTNFVGEVYDNQGFFSGGILSCESATSSCEISNVVGNIRDTECGSGCVIFSEGSALLKDIRGDFKRNNAHFDGGVIAAQKIIVSGIDGEISDNFAEQGFGGVFFSNSTQSVEISGVSLIENNFAKEDGGVVFSQDGTVIINAICLISSNVVEDGTGSVVWTGDGDISVTFSTVSNHAGTVFFSETGTVAVSPFTSLSAFASVTNATSNSYVVEAIPSNGAGSYTYLWSNGETTKIAQNIQSAQSSVEVKDSSFCSFIAQVSIPAPIANAGEDSIICPSVHFTLGASPSGFTGVGNINGPISYSWTPISQIVGSAEISNPTGFIIEDSVFSLVVTDLATGLQATDTVAVSSFPVTADAGPDATLCAGESAVLGGSPTAVSFGDLTLRYTWTPSTGLNNPTIANPTANPRTTTTYTLVVSSDECRSLRVSDEVVVFVNSVSTIKADASPVEAEDSFFICKGESIVLGGESFGNPGPIFYNWSPAAGLNSATIEHPTASPSVTTTYTLTVSSEGNCASDVDTVTIVVSDLEADAGPDILTGGVLGGVPTAIGGKAPYTYSWSPSDGLSNSQVANPSAQPSVSTTYELVITDSNNCQQSDIVSVVLHNAGTAGYVSILVSFNPVGENPSIVAITVQIRDTLAFVLSIPPLAVEIRTIIETTDDTFNVNLAIYDFGGAEGYILVDDLMAAFGCTPGVLPCVVDNSLDVMQTINWDYLEFTAPPQVDDSFSYSLNTFSFSSGLTPATLSFSTGDDDIDLTSIFTSMLLDDDDDENFSDFVSGNDDDDEPEFNLPSDSFAPNTYLSSLIVGEERNAGNMLTCSMGAIIFSLIFFLF